MEHYVTLFDSLFLPQGLALHTSMQRHIKNHTLWILCVDDEAHRAMTQLSLPNVRLLQLSQLETEDLLRVKPGRSKGEYCWTLTPFAPRFVFESDPNVSRVTYIDADIWFRKDPAPIFEEFENSGKAVLITDHAYAPENDQSATSGQYCVQFVTFERVEGEAVRDWWEKRCIEWCYGRFEDGKFGDQKYLDVWPTLFKPKVHVLMNKELCLAPWNATRFPYGNSVLYHFHGLRIIGPSSVNIGNYEIPRLAFRNLYLIYLEDLRLSILILRRAGFLIKLQKKNDLFLVEFLRFLKANLVKLFFRNTINW